MKILTVFSFLLLAALALITTVNSSSTFGQGTTNQGKDFWIAFPPGYSGPVPALFISGVNPATVTISFPGPQASVITRHIAQGTVEKVVIGSSYLLFGGVENKGIHVVSTDDIVVYGLSEEDRSTDAFLALPTHILGKTYRVATYAAFPWYPAGMSVVAVEHNTQVLVHDHVANQVRTINLNQGQTYYLAYSNGPDLTGALVESNKPLGVYGSNRCTNIGGCGQCDHIVQQLFPVSAWGTNFVNIPLAGRSGGDIYRIIAHQDNTEVTLGQDSILLEAGQFHERREISPVEIVSSKPVQVVQYARGIWCDNRPGDPFMMIIPPREQFLTSYLISTVSGFESHYINLVSPQAGVQHLKINGEPVDQTIFSQIGSTNYFGASIQIPEGTSNLESTLPFGVFAYGWAHRNSYGYPGGASTSPVALVNSVQISPQTLVKPVGDTACFEVTVLDEFSNPLESILLDINWEGRQNSDEFSYTDEQGKVEICHSPSSCEPLTDVTASSMGVESNIARVEWLVMELNDPEYVILGENYEVTWTVCGSLGTIDLYITQTDGGNLLIASGVDSNVGAFNWDVPSTLGSGMFQFKADCLDYTNLRYYSGEFYISPYEITLDIEDITGEYLVLGSQQTLNFRATGNVGNIEVWLDNDNDPQFSSIIISGSHSPEATLFWVVENGGYLENDGFLIYAKSLEFPSVQSVSGPYHIDVAKSLVPLEITQEFLVEGDLVTVQWDHFGVLGFGKLDLIYGDSILGTLAQDFLIAENSVSFVLDLFGEQRSPDLRFMLSSKLFPDVKAKYDTVEIDTVLKKIFVGAPVNYLKLGSTTLIQWQEAGFIGPVNIFLIKGTTQLLISENYSASLATEYYWNIPDALEPGKNYQFNIKSVSFPSVEGTSSLFEIDVTKVITVRPITEEYLVVGEPVTIQWDYVGDIGPVRVFLSAGLHETELTQAPVTGSYFVWDKVSTFDHNEKSNFKFVVRSANYNLLQGESLQFEIDEQKSISVHLPDFEYQILGQSMLISWDISGRMNSFSVYLMSDANEKELIASPVSGNQYLWSSVEIFGEVGKDFKIQVESTEYSVSSSSAAFEIDELKTIEPHVMVNDYVVFGETVTISWNKTGTFGQVDIFLHNSQNDFELEIARDVSSTLQVFEWNSLQLDFQRADDFLVKIEAVGYQVMGISSPFEIDEEKIVTFSNILSHPEYYQKGKQYNIEWESTGNFGFASIILICDDHEFLLSDSIDVAESSFWWTVEEIYGSSQYFQFAIKSSNYSTIPLHRSSSFEIDDKKTIEIVSPTEEYLIEGRQYMIFWNTSGFIGNVSILLLSDGECIQEIAKVDGKATGYPWTVSTYGRDFGKNFTFKVESIEYPLSSLSKGFEIDILKKLEIQVEITEYAVAGETLQIHWEGQGQFETVTLALQQAGVTIQEIDQPLNFNKKFFNWTLEDINERRTDYQILIQSTEYSTEALSSDFEIDAEKKTISIQQFDVEYVEIGSSIHIVWNFTGIPESVGIQLVRGRQYAEILAVGVDGTSGHFLWEVSETVEQGMDYSIYIVSETYPERMHPSISNQFEIDVRKTLHIFSPIRVADGVDEYLVQGEEALLEWSFTGFLQHVDLLLYQEDRTVVLLSNHPFDSTPAIISMPANSTGFHNRLCIISTKYSAENCGDPFEIDSMVKRADVLVPTFPNYWETGQNVTVRWDSNGYLGPISLVLVQEETIVQEISSYIPANQSAFLWHVEDTLEPSLSYYITLNLLNYHSVEAQNSSEFEIDNRKDITLRTPELPQHYVATGVFLNIQWYSSGNLGNCELYLIPPVGEKILITTVECNNEHYLWNVHSQELGRMHYLRIESVEYIVSSESSQFEIDEEKSVIIWTDGLPGFPGEILDIEWSSQGRVGPVYIDLWICNHFFLRLTEAPLNESVSSYEWEIGEDWEHFSKFFRIAITSTEFHVNSFSDYLAIANAADLRELVQFNLPTLPDYYLVGQNVTVSWNSTLPLGSVSIYLSFNGSIVSTLRENIGVDENSLDWSIPSSIDPSDLYQLLITFDEYTELEALTTDYFEIEKVPKSLSISSPQHYVWNNKQEYIFWAATGNVGHVSIELRRSSKPGVIATIGSQIVETTVYWLVKEIEEHAFDYYLRVSSVEYPHIYAHSSSFEGDPTRKFLNAHLNCGRHKRYYEYGENITVSLFTEGYLGPLEILLSHGEQFSESVKQQVDYNVNEINMKLKDFGLGRRTDFQLSIVSTIYPNITWSSHLFEIDHSKTLAVNLPNFSYFVVGSSATLGFEVTGSLESVQIYLYLEGYAQELIGSVSQPNHNVGNMTWEWETVFGFRRVHQDRYQIMAVAENYPNVFSLSNLFEIDIKKTLLVHTPDDEYVVAGQPLNIFWNHTGHGGTCSMFLVSTQNNNALLINDHVDCNDDEYEWEQVVANDTHGTEHKLCIESNEYSDMQSCSQDFHLDWLKTMNGTIEQTKHGYFVKNNSLNLDLYCTGTVDNVEIKLVHPHFEITLANNHHISQQFEYTIDSSLPSSLEYVIQVQSVDFGSVVWHSDTFEIDHLKSLSLQSIDDQYVVVGSNISICFDTTGHTGPIALSLVSPEHGHIGIIVSSVVSTQECYVWNNVHTFGHPVADRYSIRAVSQQYEFLQSESNDFEIDIKKTLLVHTPDDEYVVAGQPLNIYWNHTGHLGTCCLFLTSYRNPGKFWIANISCSDGKFTWNEVKFDGIYGHDYILGLESTYYGIVAFSNIFHIDMLKSIRVFVNTTFAFPGDNLSISWESNGTLSSTFDVELLTLNGTNLVHFDALSEQMTNMDLPLIWDALPESIYIRVACPKFGITGLSSVIQVLNQNNIYLDSTLSIESDEYLLHGDILEISVNSSIPLGSWQLFLVQNTSVIEVLPTIAPANPKVTWSISQNLPRDSCYQILFQSTDHSGLDEFYSRCFEIETEEKSIQILTNVKWISVGQFLPFTVSSTGYLGQVNIFLSKYDSTFSLLLNCTASNADFDWKVSNISSRGTDYYLKAISTVYPHYQAETQQFEIDTADKTITISKLKAPFLVWNDTVDVTWDSSGFVGSTSIQLIIGNSTIATVCTECPKLTNWIVPSVDPSQNYRLSITSSLYMLEDRSNPFEIDQQKSITVESLASYYWEDDTIELFWDVAGNIGIFSVILLNQYHNTFYRNVLMAEFETSYNWTLPSSLPFEQGFYFQLKSEQYPTVYNVSSSFEILKQSSRPESDSLELASNLEYLLEGQDLILKFNISQDFMPVQVFAKVDGTSIAIGSSNSSQFVWRVNLTSIAADPGDTIEFVVVSEPYPDVEIILGEIPIDSSLKSINIFEVEHAEYWESDDIFIRWNTTGLVHPLLLKLCHTAIDPEEFSWHISTIPEGDTTSLTWTFNTSILTDNIPAQGFYFLLSSQSFSVYDSSNIFALHSTDNRYIMIEYPENGLELLNGSSITITWSSNEVLPSVSLLQRLPNGTITNKTSDLPVTGSLEVELTFSAPLPEFVEFIVSSTRHPEVREDRKIYLYSECPPASYALSNGTCSLHSFSLTGSSLITSCEHADIDVVFEGIPDSVVWIWNVSAVPFVPGLEHHLLESFVKSMESNLASDSIVYGSNHMNVSQEYLLSGFCFYFSLTQKGKIDLRSSTQVLETCVSPVAASGLEAPNLFQVPKSKFTTLWARTELRECTEHDASVLALLSPDTFKYHLCVKKSESTPCALMYQNSVPFFSIPRKTLLPHHEWVAEYKIVANDNVTVLSHPETKSMIVELQPLVPKITPAEMFTFAPSKDLELDAGHSYDPDNTSENEVYLWTCVKGQSCSEALGSRQQRFSIPSGTFLNTSEEHIFALTYHKGNRVARTFIHVLPGDSLGPKLILHGEALRFNPQHILRASAEHEKEGLTSWNMSPPLDNNLSLLTPSSGKSFALAANTLHFDAQYTLNATISGRNNEFLARASLNIQTTTKSIPGKIVISQNGSDSTRITVSNFSSPHLPLMYFFYGVSASGDQLPLSKGYTFSETIELAGLEHGFAAIRVTCMDSAGVALTATQPLEEQNQKEQEFHTWTTDQQKQSFNDPQFPQWRLTYDIDALIETISSAIASGRVSSEQISLWHDLFQDLDDHGISVGEHHAGFDLRGIYTQWAAFITSQHSNAVSREMQFEILRYMRSYIALGQENNIEAVTCLSNLLWMNPTAHFGSQVFLSFNDLLTLQIIPPMLPGEKPISFETGSATIFGWKHSSAHDSVSIQIEAFHHALIQVQSPASGLGTLNAIAGNPLAHLESAVDIEVPSDLPLFFVGDIGESPISIIFHVFVRTTQEDTSTICLHGGNLGQELSGWSADPCSTVYDQESSTVECRCTLAGFLSVGLIKSSQGGENVQPGGPDSGGNTSGGQAVTVIGSVVGIASCMGCTTFLAALFAVAWKKRRNRVTRVVRADHSQWTSVAPAQPAWNE